MVDSGGYQALRGEYRGVRSTFARQVEIASAAPGSIICLLDAPLPKGPLSARERNARLERTIANAHAYDALNRDYADRSERELLAIIQGDDITSIRFCAEELARIGFDRYGIGSLVPLYNTRAIVKRVEAAMMVVGSNLHVFGIAGPKAMRELMKLNVRSVDTARPMHGAIYNEVLYSDPFRRYGVSGSHYDPRRPKFQKSRELRTPLACDCPPCQTNPGGLLALNGQKGVHHRSLHNAYHLHHEITSLAS